MKKINSFLLLNPLILCSFLNINILKTSNNSNVNINENALLSTLESDKKAYKDFTDLPSEWSLYSKSDVAYSKSSASNGELTLEHVKTSQNASNTYFWGSVYLLNTDNTYKDFTLTINFKMTNWGDGARWIGVGYHTQFDSNNLMTGYLMNYRMQDGRSAYSYFDKNMNYHDTAISGNNPINDKEYHTLQVRMKDNIAVHLMDGKEIVRWDTHDADSTLGSHYDEGGLALFINKSTMVIKSLEIIPSGEESGGINDQTLVSTYQHQSNIVNAPSVISYVKLKEDLELIKNNSIKPSNAILKFNSSKDVVDSSNIKIDSASNVIDKYLEHKVIPVFEISNSSEKDALKDFLLNERSLVDCAVISSDATLINSLRNDYPYVRGIYKPSNINDGLASLVRESTKNNCPTILLNENDATYDNVTYLQYRMKTVWTLLDDTSNDNIHNNIFTGTYGLVTPDYLKVYSKYDEYSLDGVSSLLTRMPANVAHRGLPKKCNENSVSGVKKAIESGATHLELDAYVTLDNIVVLDHDGVLGRTNNGPNTKRIENLTYSQLMEYDLIQFEPYEKIPTIEEIFDAMLEEKDSNAILVLELKSKQSNTISLVMQALSKYEKLKDRLVFISFYEEQCKRAREVAPEIPCADLNSVTTGNFIEKLKLNGTNGSIYDISTGNKMLNEQYFKDRGIVGWYWTMDTSDAVDSFVKNGLFGLTNNIADYLGANYLFKVESKDSYQSYDFNKGDSIDVKGIMYDGKEIDIKGNVETILKENNKTYVSISYKYNDIKRYSPLIELKKEELKKDGCGGNIASSSIIIASLMFMVFILSVIALFKYKKIN